MFNCANLHAMTTAEDLLTTAQVADILKVHPSSVNRLAAAGALPVARRLPGRTGANLFGRQAVETLLNAQLEEDRARHREQLAALRRATAEAVAS